MSDSINTYALVKSSPRSVFLFNNRSDGTGETNVQKIDISDLPGAPTKIKINKIIWSVSGMAVQIMFDHTANDTAIILTGEGELNLCGLGGIVDPASAGGTGDILFSTLNADADDGYSIILEVEEAP